MVCGMTYYQICWFFLIYSFAGWVIEVIYHAVALGKVINRGFLNGPVCPVYGFGMLAVFAMTSFLPGGRDAVAGRTAQELSAKAAQMTGAQESAVTTIALFLGGMLLATLVELIAGWILDKAFHARWWDYSDRPFNLHGYICAEFSFKWGIGILIAVKVAHPILSHASDQAIPTKYGWPILAALYLIYLIDFIVSVLMMQGLNRKLKELDEIRTAMRKPSDRITKVVAGTAIRTDAVIETGKLQAALGKAELRDARQRRAEELRKSILLHRHFGQGRFLAAFPDLHHRDYHEVIEELRKRQEVPESDS